MVHKKSRLNEHESYHVQDPDSLAGETDRMSRIPDAKCSQADSCTVANYVKMSNDDKRARLEHILKNSKSSFDGAPGRWMGRKSA